MTPGLPALSHNPQTWAEATAAVRQRATWLIAVFGVMAVALFGTAAIVSRPALSFSQDWPRLAAAFGAAVVGVALALYVVSKVGQVLAPTTSSWRDLVEANANAGQVAASDELPAGETWAGFVDSLDGARTSVADLRVRRSASELALVLTPDDADVRRRVRVDRGLLHGALRRLEEYESAAGRLGEWQGYLAVARERSLSSRVYVAGVAAAGCGIAFQLLLATAPETEEAAPAATAEVGTLVRVEGRVANDELWSSLGLDGCRTEVGELDGIPVLVRSGAGTPDAPYRVATLPQVAGADCPAIEFDVLTVVADVVLPTPQEISVTYEDAVDEP